MRESVPSQFSWHVRPAYKHGNNYSNEHALFCISLLRLQLQGSFPKTILMHTCQFCKRFHNDCRLVSNGVPAVLDGLCLLLPIPSTMGKWARVVTSAGTLVVHLCCSNWLVPGGAVGWLVSQPHGLYERGGSL